MFIAPQIVCIDPLDVVYFKLGPAGLNMPQDGDYLIIEEDIIREIDKPVLTYIRRRLYFKFNLQM